MQQPKFDTRALLVGIFFALFCCIFIVIAMHTAPLFLVISVFYGLWGGVLLRDAINSAKAVLKYRDEQTRLRVEKLLAAIDREMAREETVPRYNWPPILKIPDKNP